MGIIKIIVELDGDYLCIKRADFINLQESPAMFIKLSEKERHRYKRFFDTKHCSICGVSVIEHTNAKGLCDVCDK